MGVPARRERRATQMATSRAATSSPKTPKIATCIPKVVWLRQWASKDHVVVETKDAVLVAPKDRVQDVKNLVGRLKKLGRSEHSAASWSVPALGQLRQPGEWPALPGEATVREAGCAAFLQLHHHRAEHWVVVSGTARITRGEETFLLEENQSTYIPVGVRHRIENPGKIPLHVIEVQSGSYLGEDDIVRFEDRYGREGTNK